MTRSRGLESAMDRVDRFRTSADELVLSGQRAVVMCDGLLRGSWFFFTVLHYLVNSHIVQSWARASVRSPTGALLHRYFPSNLSTTWLGAIVKLHRASSESCTLLSISVWNSKSALIMVRELFWGMLGRGDGGLRGIGVSGSGYNKVLTLEVLNVVDCVERRRRGELLASVSAPRAVAGTLPFQACLRVYICTCCMCVRMCAYVCKCTDVHLCMYMRVYMYIYLHACIYMCICMCMNMCT